MSNYDIINFIINDINVKNKKLSIEKTRRKIIQYFELTYSISEQRFFFLPYPSCRSRRAFWWNPVCLLVKFLLVISPSNFFLNAACFASGGVEKFEDRFSPKVSNGLGATGAFYLNKMNRMNKWWRSIVSPSSNIDPVSHPTAPKTPRKPLEPEILFS